MGWCLAGSKTGRQTPARSWRRYLSFQPFSRLFSTCFMSESVSGAEPRHVSVLPVEVLAALAPEPGEIFVDATVGAGGHSRLLAERVLPGGRLIGLDRDPAMLELACSRLASLPVKLIQAPFSRLREVLDELNIDAVDGVLADHLTQARK